MLVSFYSHSLDTAADQPLELADVLAGIKAGRWRVEVEAVRAQLPGSKAYAEAEQAVTAIDGLIAE
jgi:hypothetical protein